ncbi:hypothetical protein FHX48_000851 [Microbacterium halimionae]|uniref:Uncharacterized protein n=1 Tax=Microbacterium halimionae TaxID=1526413 RepID=A0A7W3JMU6_9MICO|nr:hypothetical protein [Microbacterium halimionae]NII95845.1 hypothetical protein [Microbacterium halimionae]
MDAQLSSDIMLGVIGAIVAVGFVGTVLAFWSMGRQAYRK